MNILRIKETCLYVSDLEVTRRFYEDQLGFKLFSLVPGRHVFFRTGESMLLCFLPEVTKADQKLPPHYGEGKLHLAFECDRAEYEGWKTGLEGKGIPVIHEEHWPNGLRSIYFHDPDGHVLEIIEEGLWEM